MPHLNHDTSPIRDALRRAISAHHAAASDTGALARLREPDLHPDEYDRLLVRFHALHQVLADTVTALACPPWTRYFHLALRLSALNRDLNVRHLQASSRAQADATSIFCSLSAKPVAPLWAGRAYILVGSLMGARVLRGVLTSSLRINESNGGAFFCLEPEVPDGNLTASLFFDLLETTAWSQDEAAELCGTAAEFMRAHAEYWNLPLEH
ncbi:hypothetical protein [Methyloterricola oryzae]|uniref:hypothetical protein n=1 Tax=Methyloterricola oryzae TaxID=1495050 RepID=UPI0005EB79F6|nr:hypothetical protein [Methyloterricola oryzae]